jgi:hypothetical protein
MGSEGSPGGARDAAASRGMVRDAVLAYTYVAIWISLSATVILYNKWLLFYHGKRPADRQIKRSPAQPRANAGRGSTHGMGLGRLR